MSLSDHTQSQWYQERIQPTFDQYGVFPPPWVYVPDSHPYSLGWRIGASDTYLDLYNQWWRKQNYNEQQRIEYFKLMSPPPRWYAWVAVEIWDLKPCEYDDYEFDYQPYFKRLSELGFKDVDQYQYDLDNE